MRNRDRSFLAQIAAPRLLAAGSAIVLSLGFLLAAAAPASAASPAATGVGYNLSSGSASFSSGGHTWHLRVTVQGGKLGTVLGSNSVGISISTSHLRGTEEHSWSATEVPAHDFTVGSKGTATVKTGTDLSPVAALSLTFSPKTHVRASCASGSGTDYAGTLTGAVSLTTGMKGVKVSKRFTFSKPNTLAITKACFPPSPCSFSSWAGAEKSAGIAPLLVLTIAGGNRVGRPGHQTEVTSVGRGGIATSLPTMTRGDAASIITAAPTFSSAAKSLKVTGSSSGIVTGKGVIGHAVRVSHTSHICTLGGHKYTETTSQYTGTFSSSKTFEAHTLLTGTIKGASKSRGFFTIVTLKRK